MKNEGRGGAEGGRKDFRLPSRCVTCGMRGAEEGAGGKSPSLRANFEKAVSPVGSSSHRNAQEDFYMGQKGQESIPPLCSVIAGCFSGEEHQLGACTAVNPLGLAVRGSWLPALLMRISSSFLKGDRSGTLPGFHDRF